MFASLGGVSLPMFVASVLAVAEPATPPSRAQAAAVVLRKQERTADFRSTMTNYRMSLIVLFLSKTFVLIWIVFALIGPILRCNHILLSSIILRKFSSEKDVDKWAGSLLP